MKKSLDSYIDIHSHILPQIDDGAESFDTSMEMLRTAWGDGIREIILTPHNKPAHHNAGPEKIELLIKDLQKRTKEEGINMAFHMGNEMYYGSDMTEKLDQGKACTMAGSAYVLIEFGVGDDFDHIRYGLYEALAHGWRPILAHVERYSRMLMKTERVEDLVRMGCYIQVNAGSIMGDFGFGARQLTKKLLAQGLVHFVATDAHDMGKRRPMLSECARYVGKKYGEEYGERLFYGNPMRVIRDVYI
ncbi:CpsB/CapC family capsule biosynthesis tyrosine phosphatase [Parablautia muri]|uniref:protein-tyrosine-phosphatase n=1 Tax=Parablautia muri TaxID=2320879 RepID=A0A9X5GTB6_9FIRM|nr:hypothetical protein [Parablautia muri]